MSPRPRETSDAAILAATQRAVSRLGPVKLTLAHVAKEAGVSPATLLQRFGSKRGLLLAFAAIGGEGGREQFAEIRAGARSPLDALGDVAACIAGFADTPEALSNRLAFLQNDLTDPDFHTHALAHANATRGEIRALLEDAIDAGQLGRGDTARLARAVQAMFNGSLLQWAIDRDGRVADRLREDLDTLLRPRHHPPERRLTQVRKVRKPKVRQN